MNCFVVLFILVIVRLRSARADCASEECCNKYEQVDDTCTLCVLDTGCDFFSSPGMTSEINA